MAGMAVTLAAAFCVGAAADGDVIGVVATAAAEVPGACTVSCTVVAAAAVITAVGVVTDPFWWMQ